MPNETAGEINCGLTSEIFLQIRHKFMNEAVIPINLSLFCFHNFVKMIKVLKIYGRNFFQIRGSEVTNSKRLLETA